MPLINDESYANICGERCLVYLHNRENVNKKDM